MEPQGETEAGEGKLCVRACALHHRRRWGFAQPHLLRRLATWLQCLCVPLLAEEGSKGLGKGYSHHLKGWQLIKDPRLQTGEDVSRYVSAVEQGDGILGSPWAGGEPLECRAHEGLGSLPSHPTLHPRLPCPHSQPEKPGEALEGPGGETADPVVGEVPGETCRPSAGQPRGSTWVHP